jgi:ferredoxin
MIITIQKDVEDILNHIEGNSVFLIGCSECATLCQTGGEQEIQDMKNLLEENNLNVTGSVILDPACHLNNNRRLLKPHRDAIEKAETILVLSCGNGVQTIAELIPDRNVFSGTHTLFLGEIKRANEFEKRCVMCGTCIQHLYNGICPVARCPKNMLNGPCGGSTNGKCEVDKETDCIWDLIYQKAKDQGHLDRLKRIQDPKKWSTSTISRRKI